MLMSQSNGRIMVKRNRGTAFEQDYLDIIKRSKFSVNVWGCMIGASFTFRVSRVDA